MTYLSCAFTGHRDLGADFDIELLDKVILNLIKHGTEHFLCGMARGFDLTAGEIVVKYKEKYGLKLTACIPYEGHIDSMGKANAKRYRSVLERCDEKVVFAQEYNYLCMHARDRYMVENSDVLISYLRKESGGTFFTVKYARALGRQVIEV